MKTGIERIAAERQRQIDAEGWTPEHDDEHQNHSLAMAAACYAAPEQLYARTEDAEVPYITFGDPWPWDAKWDKRPRFDDTDRLMDADDQGVSARIRCLEKAGALCAAEIDRLQRARVNQLPSEGGSRVAHATTPRAPCSRCGLLRYPSCPTEGCPLREVHHQVHGFEP